MSATNLSIRLDLKNRLETLAGTKTQAAMLERCISLMEEVSKDPDSEIILRHKDGTEKVLVLL